MLDGLRYVIAQVALIVAVVALLAGVLGWLLGRARGSRRAEKVAATPASRLTPAPVKTPPSFSPRRAMEPRDDVPVAAAEEVAAPIAPFAPAPIMDVTEPVDTPAPVEPEVAPRAVAPTTIVAEPVIKPDEASTDAVPEPAFDESDDDVDEDPDRTVLRPAPSMASATTTPQYAPPPFAVTAPAAGTDPVAAMRQASVQEVQELRRELRAKELEVGKLEAGALSAWDRTVPALEARISDLTNQNDALRRTIRDAEEHSDADAQTVERLRSLVAERDTRLAEIRAQS